MVVVVDVDVGVVVGTLKVELDVRRVDDTTAMNRHSPHVGPTCSLGQPKI